MSVWQSLLETAGASFAILVGATVGLSWLNGLLVQHIVNRRGKASSQLWVMKPGLLVHESLHALVGKLFGLHIAEYSLRPDASGRTAGHVTFTYSKKTLWQRLGLSVAASAPLWGISAILVLSGKWILWPGQPWRTISVATISAPWWQILLWVGVALLLSFGANLSPQDLRGAAKGLPFLLIALIAMFALGWWLVPALLLGWRQVNLVACGVVLLLGCFAGLAAVITR
ncbi:hypothetical protein [Lacticaseibacillus yichunensis]|uniref:Peptidase M50B-like protein n=1 Tax=Lacticaseibacillus yichunensis TaxID=2486015 RepID=A0ABW4CN10_9LACO|nr:hypothetical protein [Lacticaseibacillus yichunensis]